MSRGLPESTWSRIQELYLMVDEKGKRLFGPKAILSIIMDETGESVSRQAIQQRAVSDGWKREPGATVTDALVLKLRESQQRGKEPPKEPGERKPRKKRKPPADIDRTAATKVREYKKTFRKLEALKEEDSEAILVEQRAAIANHLATYLTGTEKVTRVALNALEFELYFHQAIARKVKKMIDSDVDPIGDKVQALRRGMLSPTVLTNIVRLGQVMTGSQLNLVIQQIQNTNTQNNSYSMSWEGGDKFAGTPPMPTEVDIQANEDEDVEEATWSDQ